MTDQVQLSCTFYTDIVLSPILDLYTCNTNMFFIISYPPDIILNQYSSGDISFNIDSYI